MRFDAAQIEPMPWKNGGGTTRELAVRKGARGLIWRLSLAEIAQNGPFSAFPGLWRVHTIIAGKGLCLHGTDAEREAKPLTPLEFDGGLALEARLIDGPCRAVNVIFDPRYVQVKAQVHQGDFAGQAGDLAFVIDGALHLGRDHFVAAQGCELEAPAQGVVEGTVLHVQIKALQEAM
ncbi:HutD family protein [Epibacterium sp. MM17-32]|uniref:HutD/Ves family protein n=1 Tax=Epibacterium sp. MM17-32 TaxID=2917734 RepID=UPI001EF54A29|nr:HutD family protein [Epibacterium sp. MM17-32]MCG7628134.1 HutD family protein [Epibacterium sp. MM17-32]